MNGFGTSAILPDTLMRNEFCTTDIRRSFTIAVNPLELTPAVRYKP
jgi:hypothetical protein